MVSTSPFLEFQDTRILVKKDNPRIQGDKENFKLICEGTPRNYDCFQALMLHLLRHIL